MRVELELERVPPGARQLVSVGGVEIAVFNVDGRIYALDNVCPHRGGPLIRGTIQPSPRGPVLRCPMHGWPFDLATGVSVRPGRATVYPARLRDGVIEIEIEAAPEPAERKA